MKNKILLLVLMITMIGYGSEGSTFSKKYDIEKTIISFNNIKKGQQLIIKDYSGVILYSEVLEEIGTYIKKFDFSALPSGNYVMELNKDMKIIVTPIKIENDKVEIFSDKEVVLYKPIVRSNGSKVYLSRLSMSGQPLKVKIYYDGDNNEELIYSEKFKNQNIIERIYALDERLKGLYKIIVSTEGRTFSQVVNLF
ncbi:MAG: hypothetical protein KC469_07140 [Flavobacteriaceae bacterium]|nr:hypothetical protein [Flavobacteriaceae bacterium]